MGSQKLRDEWWHNRQLLDDNQSSLSDWELDFFESIDNALNAGLELSWRRSKKLREIAKEYDR